MLAPLGFLFAGCAATSGDSALVPAAVPGDLAPDFTLASNTGATVTLSDYADHAVLLDFGEFW